MIREGLLVELPEPGVALVRVLGGGRVVRCETAGLSPKVGEHVRVEFDAWPPTWARLTEPHPVAQAIDAGRLIQAQPPGRCELCQVVKETRPYGPNGEEVCFDCGMKDEAAMRAGFDRRYGT